MSGGCRRLEAILKKYPTDYWVKTYSMSQHGYSFQPIILVGWVELRLNKLGSVG